ncbi:MAG TPA: type II secretion system F family protein [Candidatus Ratteibacteria bacterium]|nr:type II secretion system F family protein [bacterium]HRR95863.1 type II secretion system F family protein [Candidatus Ratteibacteria bacterium]
MPHFQYNAIDQSGNSLTGTIEAGHIQEAIGKLKSMGYYITNVAPARNVSAVSKSPDVKPNAPAKKTGKEKAKTKGKGQGMQIKLSFGPAKIKPKELMIITRQLATLIGSGLPLLRSLRVLKEQRKGGAAVVLGKVADDIESGALFSEALAKHPTSFPRIYVAMIKAGEAGGALETVLARLAEFMEKEAKLKGKIKGAMAYPVVIVIVASGILTFIMMKIVPTFVDIFKDFETDLPAPTILLINLSKLFTQKFYLIIIFVVSIFVLYKILTKIKFTKYWIDMAKMKIPVFGPVVSKTIISRFARTFATLITSGVPILQSLLIVRDTVGNDVVAKAINEVRNRVREGEGVSGPMMRTKVFPAMVTNMIAVGEETGAMDSMLEKVADAYDAEVDAAVAAMTSMLEPMLIVCMGGVVGFIVISLFMPLIKLAMSMSGEGG